MVSLPTSPGEVNPTVGLDAPYVLLEEEIVDVTVIDLGLIVKERSADVADA
jgi:hypothetical protein